jgi:hypothetical protein
MSRTEASGLMMAAPSTDSYCKADPEPALKALRHSYLCVQ